MCQALCWWYKQVQTQLLGRAYVWLQLPDICTCYSSVNVAYPFFWQKKSNYLINILVKMGKNDYNTVPKIWVICISCLQISNLSFDFSMKYSGSPYLICLCPQHLVHSRISMNSSRKNQERMWRTDKHYILLIILWNVHVREICVLCKEKTK